MADKHPREIESRWLKATKLAALLHAYGILACELPRIGSEHWAHLAVVVMVNAPSAETIAVIDTILRAFEAAEAAEALRDQQAGERPVDIKEVAK